MASAGSKLHNEIQAALHRITDVILQQCVHGAQTKSLPSHFAACGQFIGDEASRIEQYGLHGIAAALRVLGPCQSEQCHDIVKRLVKYCEASLEIDAAVTIAPNQRVQALDNVIKLGELLYALSFVPPSQADVSGLARHVAELLQGALKGDRGWGYFLNDPEPKLLPTAYATRGLEQNGFDVTRPRKFIIDSLQAGGGQSSNESSADLTTAVTCAYCLTFARGASTNEPTLVETFRSAWRALEPLLGEDVEQNLEYWRGKETHYVRVPWQLYLLALASEYNVWRFATFRSQTRLRAILNGLKSASFKYPYSGRFLSSRTNAIAYDALSVVDERVRRLTFLPLAYAVDRLRVIAGSRPVRATAAVFACLLIVYSIAQWLKTGKASELAPNFIASLVTLLLAFARR